METELCISSLQVVEGKITRKSEYHIVLFQGACGLEMWGGVANEEVTPPHSGIRPATTQQHPS
jgi:hypothetical protein